MIDGALLIEADNPQTREEIISIVHQGAHVGLVKKKQGYFLAEFLGKSRDPQWSVDCWIEVRTSCICGTAEEALALTNGFVKEGV
jgi:hypothetical protein